MVRPIKMTLVIAIALIAVGLGLTYGLHMRVSWPALLPAIVVFGLGVNARKMASASLRLLDGVTAISLGYLAASAAFPPVSTLTAACLVAAALSLTGGILSSERET